jgi:hypothetical protein
VGFVRFLLHPRPSPSRCHPRLRAGVGAEARDALLRDMPGLRLEKYVEELVGALPEGLARCAKEKDVAAAGEVRARRVEGEPGEL